MSWKNWSAWLGGIIGICLPLLFLFILPFYVVICNIIGLCSDRILTLLIGIIIWPSWTIIFKGADPSSIFTVYILSVFISSLAYFFIGFVIGWIVGKIRNR